MSYYCCTLQTDLTYSSIFTHDIVLIGIGSSVLAGVLYVYLSRRGDGGDGDGMLMPTGEGSHDNITIVGSGQSHINTQLFDASPTNRNSIEGGNFDTGW